MKVSPFILRIVVGLFLSTSTITAYCWWDGFGADEPPENTSLSGGESNDGDQRLFLRMDKDSNGSLSLDEFRQGLKNYRGVLRKRREAVSSGKRRFARLDVDGDRFLSKPEFDNAPLIKRMKKPVQFDDVDRNKDGKIAIDEFFSIKVKVSQ